MMPSQSDRDPWEDWQVLPEGAEGVIVMRMPPPAEEPTACFVCGEQVPAVGACWGIRGRGIAHGHCYEPNEDD